MMAGPVSSGFYSEASSEGVIYTPFIPARLGQQRFYLSRVRSPSAAIGRFEASQTLFSIPDSNWDSVTRIDAIRLGFSLRLNHRM
jgi:hypothetical protein